MAKALIHCGLFYRTVLDLRLACFPPEETGDEEKLFQRRTDHWHFEAAANRSWREETVPQARRQGADANGDPARPKVALLHIGRAAGWTKIPGAERHPQRQLERVCRVTPLVRVTMANAAVLEIRIAGVRVAHELDWIAKLRCAPCMVVPGHGTEPTSNAMLQLAGELQGRLVLHRAR